MKKTKEKIEHLLIQKPSLKDSDSRLTTHIWYNEMIAMGIDPHKTPATKLLRLYANQQLTQAPTIKRARAKLQEQNPMLRGNKYKARQEAQPKWKRQLGYGI